MNTVTTINDIKLNITSEQLEPLVIALLADVLRFLLAESKTYIDVGNRKTAKAVKRVLKYYLTTDEYEKLLDKIMKQVNKNASDVLDEYI